MQLHKILTFFRYLPIRENESKNFSQFKRELFPTKLLALAANAFHNCGFSLLSIACAYGKNPQAIQLLIDFGAKINVINGSSQLTPLHCAIFNSYILTPFKTVAVVECLLVNGAITNIKDNTNETPLELAIRANQHLAVSIIKNFVKEKNETANCGAMAGLFDFIAPEIAFKIAGFLNPYDWKNCNKINKISHASYKVEVAQFMKNKKLLFLEKIGMIDAVQEVKSEPIFENTKKLKR